MIPPFKNVTVFVTETPAPYPNVTRPPKITFEERWEREGKWLLGPYLLSDIVRHMMGKSLVVIRDPDDKFRIIVSLPELPKVRNELDSELVSAYWMIPAELRPIFEHCCAETLGCYMADIDLLKDRLLYRALSDALIHEGNALLADYEYRRRSNGELELWQVLAECFGLNWQLLPDVRLLTPETCPVHEWKDKTDSIGGKDVVCNKCGMPGERDSTVEGGVFFPAT